MGIETKLKELRESKGLSMQKAADALGVPKSTYVSYEYGKREPNIEMINRIASFYKVSTDYLLGREPRKEPYYHADLEEGLREAYKSLPRETRAMILQAMLDAVLSYREAEQKEPDAGTVKEIVRTVLRDYYDDPASAGAGDILGDGSRKKIKIVATTEAEEADCVIRISGRSMEDTYFDGDLVLVRYQKEIPIGKVGIFRQNGKGFIKEAGEDYLISHNPDYPNIYPNDGEIECIGLVIGVAELVK